MEVEREIKYIGTVETSFPLILGVKSQNHVEEEAVKNSPPQQDSNIIPNVLQLKIHGGQNIITYQCAVY